jgi:amino acid adenylation domain-containing protein
MRTVDNGIDTLFASLREKNIFLKLNDQNNLDIEAPRDALQKDVIDAIRLHKEDIIAYLKNRAAVNGAGQSIPVLPEEASYPLSPAQTGLWLAAQLHNDSAAYSINARMELEGSYDPVLFEQAVRAVVERHEVLRTTFREGAEGTPRQQVLPFSANSFTFYYADGRGHANAGAEADQFIATDLATPFDLQNGPLFRIALFRLADNHSLLYYNLHHLVCDAWSLNILANDILACYEAFRTGQPSPLPPLRIQYKDYAAWQQSQLATPAFEVHRDYWLKRFSGTLPVLGLFGETARPAIQNTNGHVIGAFINAADAVPFRRLCAARQSSLFTGIVASLSVLFHRYSGQDDLIVGAPVSGRDHPDLHNQIGYYVNTLALRTQFAQGEIFLSLLDKTRTTVMEAYEHQSYPFDQLVRDLEYRRDTSHSPLFDFFINVQNTEDKATSVRTGEQDTLAGTNRDEPLDLGPASSKFDMVFNVFEARDDLYIAIEFNRDIFRKEQVLQLVEHYRNLLRSINHKPEALLDQLELLSNSEKDRLLFGVNTTATSYEMDTVVDLFHQQASTRGSAIALQQGKRQLNYQELDVRSNQLAHHLQGLGIGKDSLVPVYMARTPEMVAAILGILKAGAAYVPIDPGYPKERLDYVLADTEAIVMVADPLYEEILSGHDIEKIFVGVEHEAFQHQPMEAPDTAPTATDLAYVIYTSGSTGTPKGVMIDHGNLSNYMNWVLSEYIPGESEGNFGLYSSLSFDLTITSFFGSLLKGSCLSLFPQEMEVSAILREYFDVQSGLDIIKLTPSHLQLLPMLGLGSTGVKKVIVGGEALRQSHLAILRALNPDMEVLNEYGPTETTVGCSVFRITKDMDDTCIGRPVANTAIYILNASRNQVPIGVAGELYISGAQVGRGYWKREGLTADRFLDDPFRPGQRMYRTGDIGYRRADGNIEYVGRNDDQVKVRGHRVELGEVERVLARHGNIAESVVTVRGEGEEQQLVAYVVSDHPIDADTLRTSLRMRLPDYMIPQQFVLLEQLPLTVNGKVDRSRLPDPEQSLSTQLPNRYIAPQNEVEARLVEIWQGVLGISSDISVVDNFFELGGHSIKALKMLSQVSKEFGIVLGVQKLFEEPTIQDLSEKILNAGWTAPGTAKKQEGVEYESVKI